ncbi:hypothetical protein TRIUR3_21672 [Triticum urartu]|uniref:Secreted protein n=2 Tax=Triticum TaxID=4564 RepID=A0A9R1R6W9_TRITD|nr:hypothetical protein TRIUR3_21672 [Triticum urartu]VAH30392.1 unnamed protein product [Triticum turgidum subsp. durum]
MTAFQSMMLLSCGAPLIPAGGSCCSRLKSRIRRFLDGVDISAAGADSSNPLGLTYARTLPASRFGQVYCVRNRRRRECEDIYNLQHGHTDASQSFSP